MLKEQIEHLIFCKHHQSLFRINHFEPSKDPCAGLPVNEKPATLPHSLDAACLCRRAIETDDDAF